MLDIGFSKLIIIGGIALVVIGPERLPRVARTLGTLLGRAQRYVADVKAEVSRSIDVEELQKMKTQFETAARDVEQTVQAGVNQTTTAFDAEWNSAFAAVDHDATPAPAVLPSYKHPGKKWRLKRSAIPAWFKHRSGVRTHTQSGAARVSRFRPRASNIK
jgi:sec-independent protein translocase protein TatB